MDRLNVMLVDDEPDACELLRRKLSRESPDLSIITAYSAEECLDYVRRDRVDCILSDYQMPGMNGMELFDALKGMGLDIPFIFVTGQGSEDIAREAFKRGADDYFTKEVAGFAFTPRIANAIRQSVTRRRWTADILRKAAEGVPFGSGERFFRSLVTFVGTTLQVDIAFVGELSREIPDEINTISVYSRGNITENFSYSLAGTPCETVLNNKPCIYPRNVQRLFPEDEMLVQMGLESYAGVPLYDSEGKSIGILVVVHSSPLANEDLVRTLLLILADRASAELERLCNHDDRPGYDMLRTSIEAVSHPMVIIRPDHTLYMMNRSACTLFCGRAEGVYEGGIKCHKLLHNLDSPCGPASGFVCPVNEVMSTGNTVRSTHVHKHHGGRLGEMEIVASPLYSREGEIIAVAEMLIPLE